MTLTIAKRLCIDDEVNSSANLKLYPRNMSGKGYEERATTPDGTPDTETSIRRTSPESVCDEQQARRSDGCDEPMLKEMREHDLPTAA